MNPIPPSKFDLLLYFYISSSNITFDCFRVGISHIGQPIIMSTVLLTQGASTIIRHLLSADSREERLTWCSILNQALDNLRAWDPQVKDTRYRIQIHNTNRVTDFFFFLEL